MSMNKKSPQKRKEFSKKEIESFFEEVNHGGRIFSPTPNLEHKDITSDWITTSGSSKQGNKLIKVSIWQTGQTS
jgi:hypothetical protein